MREGAISSTPAAPLKKTLQPDLPHGRSRQIRHPSSFRYREGLNYLPQLGHIHVEAKTSTRCLASPASARGTKQSAKIALWALPVGLLAFLFFFVSRSEAAVSALKKKKKEHFAAVAGLKFRYCHFGL